MNLVNPPDPAGTVYTVLEEITLRPRSDLRGEVRLSRDLMVRGDAYELRLVPELERRLGIHPSGPEWATVDTVQDLIALVDAHAARGVATVPPAQLPAA
ncbi:MAG: hypothetical protein ACREMO_12250 [Gemmatimonadales bacterium]